MSLLDHFLKPQLGRPLGIEQARAHDNWIVFAGFGMLQLVVKNRRHQHRIDALSAAVGDDQGAKIFQPSQGVVAQGLKLVQSLGEQLCQGRLGTVDAETTVQFAEFFFGKVDWVWSHALTAERTGREGSKLRVR